MHHLTEPKSGDKQKTARRFAPAVVTRLLQAAIDRAPAYDVPIGVFARAIEQSLDVAIDRPQGAGAREFDRAAMLGRFPQTVGRRLAYCARIWG
jgi:hypothetical protein